MLGGKRGGRMGKRRLSGNGSPPQAAAFHTRSFQRVNRGINQLLGIGSITTGQADADTAAEE